ncbi:MAG: BatD family protein [Candidatus Cloacimonetes bacterium]|nr:BatD family protein [Candidatus Cloacimonadota bacterium]MCF7813578.1 BatD family protein [Candidatus Cloacimonadota bacterium]MCF7883627.1 BatD family protein [Candidatus Cloacimonadota bacterium]
MKKIFLIIGLILISFLNAELLRIDSYVNQTKIGTSDRLNFTIEISGEEANQVAEPDLPEIKGFRNLGSSTSTSSSVSIINGRMQSEYTKKYTYTLVPKAKGKYIIPPVTIRFKNETYKTTTITVEVVEGSTEPPPPTSRNFNRNQQKQTQNNFEENLFVIAEINKTIFWENEPITVDYTLLTRYNITNISFGEDQNFSGFWKEDVFTPSQINFSRRNYNGVLYNTMLMKTIVLFPTQSGKMEIPSMELLVDIRTEPTSFFDFGATKQYSIKSKPLRINVRELPEEGKPQNFTNAVGTYSLSSNVSDTELKVGDSFTYTLELKGEGNLKQFDVPTLPLIQHLRFLDPEITNEINQDQKSGTKNIKYLVIAQEKGTFTIPPIKFSFFDTKQGRYRTLQSDSYTLNIAEGSGSIIPSSTAQSVVRMEGKDIGFIIKDTNLRNKKIWFDSFLYWLIIFLIFLIIPTSSLYTKQKEKLQGNLDFQRQRRANKILKKYMKQATEYHKIEDVRFYAAAQTGLSSYLCDKLRIPRGSTTDQIITEISSRNIQNELLEKIKDIFETCNKARFMPGGFSRDNIQADFLELKEIITEISRSKL